MRYRTPTYTVDIEDWEGKCSWRCKLKVTTWGRPARRYGVPMSERHEAEPAEYEVLSVSRTVHGISVSEVIEHPDPEAFAAANDEEIWEDIENQRRDELEDYDV
tara:strand:- start:186 stop:497 length:312 start_codon:yes stop_codon:yes gene_type:complete